LKEIEQYAAELQRFKDLNLGAEVTLDFMVGGLQTLRDLPESTTHPLIKSAILDFTGSSFLKLRGVRGPLAQNPVKF